MRFRSKKPKFNFHQEIQIAPFIDIVLVLLIIFMITVPAMLSGVKIELPNGSVEQEEEMKTFLTVTYTKNGDIYLDDDQVQLVNMVRLIKDKTSNSLDYTIFVRGDKTVKYGDVMSVVNILNKAGYKKTVLVTENS